MTPTVHSAEEVSLDVEAEYKLLGAGSYNGIPVISNRKFQGKVRLRTTEWAVLAGLFTDEQSRVISGIPGLADIPVFGVALRENTTTKSSSNVLILIKTHVTSLPGSEYRHTCPLGRLGDSSVVSPLIAATLSVEAMFHGEALRFSFHALNANKVRTFLTALGLVIGNASVILVVTISITSRDYILDQIRAIGSNMIYAQYEAGSNTTAKVEADYVNLSDLDAVRKQLGVAHRRRHRRDGELRPDPRRRPR